MTIALLTGADGENDVAAREAMTAKPRTRSRYAPDNQIDRAAEFALKYGLALTLNADGSVKIDGKLNADVKLDGEKSAEEALEAWKRASGDSAARR